ncbi:MAG: hypothetical protein HGB12_15745 [Bacteroidetes bacterium]|nr:hypothetical protein [Bacteroidota bacterium]
MEENKIEKLANKTNFDRKWEDYDSYRTAVIQYPPQNLSLRDKDKLLWGKSFYRQLIQDLKNNFEPAETIS